MLEIRRLAKRYNCIPALEDVSFTIRPVEIPGHVGPNEAGKSTTVRLIIGHSSGGTARSSLRDTASSKTSPPFSAASGCCPATRASRPSEFMAKTLARSRAHRAVWIWPRRRRLEGWGEANPLYDLYEDLPGTPPDLGIRDRTWRPHREQEAH